MITQDELKSQLKYDKDTGIFTRAVSNNKRFRVGDKVGYVNKGYIMTKVLGHTYLAHRLAWIHEYGDIDSSVQIDHKNHIRTDNRIDNLRLVVHSDNAKNQKKSILNTSGFTGVTYNKVNKNWKAQIMVNYKKIYLGSFKDKEDAIAARKAANIKYEFHSNHGKDL